jgi:hypothetical protein
MLDLISIAALRVSLPILPNPLMATLIPKSYPPNRTRHSFLKTYVPPGRFLTEELDLLHGLKKIQFTLNAGGRIPKRKIPFPCNSLKG